jgi:hypothetical protein
MEVRYQGFEQQKDRRAYRFDVRDKGGIPRQMVVTVDMALFKTHRVAFQEGPGLCARKLTADLETCIEGDHSLTTDDLRQYAEACATAAAKKLETRQNSRHVKPSTRDSPWRRTPV